MSEKKAKAENATTVQVAETTVSNVVEPKLITLIGSVELVNKKSANIDAGGKFSKDTYIISLNVPKRVNGELIHESKNVFITVAQWKEYGCEAVIYNGNYVKLTVEECIANVTGYKKDPDDDFLTVHEKTFDAFHSMTNVSEDVLMMHHEYLGISERLSDRILNTLARTRESYARRKDEKELYSRQD